MRHFVHMGLGGVVLAGSMVAGCASPNVQKADVYVTRDQRVVAQPGVFRPGETILNIENDDGAAHVVVLAKLSPSTNGKGLPLVDGLVPVGGAAIQHYDGHGYRVVAKSERMAAYFNGPNRVQTAFNIYLEPGRYIVFCDAPGDYAKGESTMLTVTR